MASWQSRVARVFARVFVRRVLAKNAESPEQLCAAMRRTLESGDARNAKIPGDIEVISVAGPVPGEWVKQKDVAFGDRAVLYMHGGGMAAGTPSGYRGMITIPLARRLGVPVFAVDYRRTPEFCYPAQLEDCIAAYRLLREKVPAAGIIFAGDSAGGNLVLATLLALRERDGVAQPCGGVIAMSPWADLAGTGASAHENAATDDMLLPPSEKANLALVYAGTEPVTNPLVSPFYGDYTGAPPILLFASTIEMLRDDSIRLAEKLRALGVPVTLSLVADMLHVWPLISILPESAKALDLMQTFAAEAWRAAPREPLGTVSI